VLVENDAPIAMYLYLEFHDWWLGTAVFMLVYHFSESQTRQRMSLVDIDAQPGSQANETISDPMQKLRSLEALKRMA